MISILQLQYFRSLAEDGQMTRTAQKLFITQTTLSSMIAKLEKDLGVQLFDRTKGRLSLNENGRKYLTHVKKALAELEEGQQELSMNDSSRKARLSIAVSFPLLWQDLLLKFMSRYPAYSLDLHADSLPHFSEGLISEHLDMVITGTGDLTDPRFQYMEYTTNGLCVCMAPTHPLANRKSICLKELESIPVVSLSRELPFQSFLTRLCVQAGVTLQSVAECDYMLRSRLVGQGVGVAVIVDTPSSRSNYPGQVFVPVSDELARRGTALFWLKGRSFTPAMRDFREFLSNYQFPAE